MQFNSKRQSHFLEAGSNNDCKVLAAFVQMRQTAGEWRENLQDSPCYEMLLLVVATNQLPLLILSGCFWIVEHFFQCTPPTLQLWHIHMCHGQTVDCVSVSRVWSRYQEADQYTRRSRGGCRRATTQQQGRSLLSCARSITRKRSRPEPDRKTSSS